MLDPNNDKDYDKIKDAWEAISTTGVCMCCSRKLHKDMLEEYEGLYICKDGKECIRKMKADYRQSLTTKGGLDE